MKPGGRMWGLALLLALRLYPEVIPMFGMGMGIGNILNMLHGLIFLSTTFFMDWNFSFSFASYWAGSETGVWLEKPPCSCSDGHWVPHGNQLWWPSCLWCQRLVLWFLRGLHGHWWDDGWPEDTQTASHELYQVSDLCAFQIPALSLFYNLCLPPLEVWNRSLEGFCGFTPHCGCLVIALGLGRHVFC